MSDERYLHYLWVNAAYEHEGTIFKCIQDDREIKVVDRTQREEVGMIKQEVEWERYVFKAIVREKELLPNVLFVSTMNGIVMVDKDTYENKLLFKQTSNYGEQAISLKRDGGMITIATIDNNEDEKKRMLHILKIHVHDGHIEEGFVGLIQ